MLDYIVSRIIIIASDNNSLLEPLNMEHLSPQSENLTVTKKKDCFAMGSVWLTSLDNDHYVFVSMVFFALLFHTLLYLF